VNVRSTTLEFATSALLTVLSRLVLTQALDLLAEQRAATQINDLKGAVAQ